jgi:hypothetical protein
VELPMRTCLSLALAATLAALAAPLAAQTAADTAEIRAVVDGYFRGQATGDATHFRAIFQPSANLYWIRDGKYAERPSAEWMAGYDGKPPADEAQRRRRLASLDVTGNVAVTKLVSDYPTAVVTDYLTLLKTETGWKAVAKAFVVQPRAR